MKRNSRGQFVRGATRARTIVRSIRSRARHAARGFRFHKRKVTLVERLEKPVQHVVAPTFGALAAASPFLQMPAEWNASGPIPVVALVEHVANGNTTLISGDIAGLEQGAIESIPKVAEFAILAVLTRWAGRKFRI